MGGGDSLLWSFLPWFCKLPDDPVLISANQHGALLAESGFCRRPDYIVAVDRRMGPIELKKFDIPLVSHHEWADIKMDRKPRVWGSGHVAAFVAAEIFKCAPVILSGMDCYTDGTYWHRRDAKSTGHSYELREHLERWTALRHISKRGDFRTVGGPLLELFPGIE